MKLLIISGRSGSGKSTVLHVLEDRGFYCIDNLPASLLPALALRLSSDISTISNIAVSIDARNVPSDLERVPDLIRDLAELQIQPEIIFLDASSQTLLRRFSESRRKHPLSSEKIALLEAINKESQLLESISLMASLTLDTSNTSLHQLRDRIKLRVLDNAEESMSLLFQSFGYKNGIPVDADLVYDVRCLPNPYWDTTLRALTGRHEAVVNFLDHQQEVQKMYQDIVDYLREWLPKFEENNRSYMTVAIGCTGGQHRSVYLCDKLYKTFAKDSENVKVTHREINEQY